MATRGGQARSQAQKRVDLSKMENVAKQPEETTIDGVLSGLAPHVAAAIATLGAAASDGDVQAAKAILDWVKAANADKVSTKGQDMLDRIAKIRQEATDGPTI